MRTFIDIYINSSKQRIIVCLLSFTKTWSSSVPGPDVGEQVELIVAEAAEDSATIVILKLAACASVSVK